MSIDMIDDEFKHTNDDMSCYNIKDITYHIKAYEKLIKKVPKYYTVLSKSACILPFLTTDIYSEIIEMLDFWEYTKYIDHVFYDHKVIDDITLKSICCIETHLNIAIGDTIIINNKGVKVINKTFDTLSGEVTLIIDSDYVKEIPTDIVDLTFINNFLSSYNKVIDEYNDYKYELDKVRKSIKELNLFTKLFRKNVVTELHRLEKHNVYLMDAKAKAVELKLNVLKNVYINKL